MRYSEFNPLKPFKAQVRLKTDKSMLLILTWADSHVSARRNLAYLYGTENVLIVSEITQQAKLTNARKAVTKAQQQLSKATAPTTFSSQQ